MRNGVFLINSPDNLWHAEISACRGANVEKLTYKGKDVLVPLENENQWREHPLIQGSPLLFPANRTVGGRFIFQGREYRLQINDKKNNLNLHGLLYLQSFSVVSADKNSIKLQYDNKGEVYPLCFSLTAEYTLENNGLKQKFTIKNTGKTDMPYTFALHTTFVEPAYFRAPISLVQEKDSKHIPTGRYIALTGVEADCAAGTDPRGRAISGYYKASGNTAVIGEFKYVMSDLFDHCILFNGGGGSGFICAEPQVGAVNGLNIPGGHRVIPAGEQDILTVSIEKR